MQFKFQPILNLKKHHEDKCRTRLSEEQTKLLRIKQELATLAKTKKNQQKEVETLLVGKIKPELLTSGSKSLEYIHQKQIETNTRKSIQEEQVNLARTVLIEARKGRKTMEKLKENYMIREQQKIMVTEQKRLDEVANNLFYREQR